MTGRQDPGDFSLALGGPLFQLWRRLGLSGDDMELLRRRVVVMTLLAWLPLLLLSVAAGSAWGQGVALTFLQDAEIHVRLLVAMPLLIVADVMMHREIPRMVGLFVKRDLIPAASLPRFDAAIAAAVRLRNSMTAELLLLALVYGIGAVVLWRTQVVLDVSSWYGTPVDGGLRPSAAGWWMRWVSVPMFQFLALRWYFRLFVWARFLWQVSRIDLQLVPTHPDRAGGIGFLAGFGRAFSPVLLAQGTVLAGMVANRIFYAGASLVSFKAELAGTAVLLTLIVVGPLFVFTPQLLRARRAGIREYGTLAQRYVREFDHKWLRGGAPDGAPLVGSPDIQSLDGLGGSFAMVRAMRPLPCSARFVLALALVPVLPAAPLLLTTFSFEQILNRVLAAIL